MLSGAQVVVLFRFQAFQNYLAWAMRWPSLPLELFVVVPKLEPEMKN